MVQVHKGQHIITMKINWQLLMNSLNSKFNNIFELENSASIVNATSMVKIVARYQDYTYEFLTIVFDTNRVRIFEDGFKIEIYTQDGLLQIANFLIAEKTSALKFFIDKQK